MRSRHAKHLPWKEIGQVSVDTGTVLISDPCYVTPETMDDVTAGLEAAEHCQLQHSNGAPLGVAVHSSMGDGIYEVYVQRSESGRVVAMQIRFDHGSP